MIATSKATRDEPLDWPEMALWAVFGVAATLVAFQAGDLFVLLRNRQEPSTFLWQMFEALGISIRPVLLLAICTYLARLGTQGLYVAFIALLASLFVVFQFRGDNILPGTFDFFEESTGRWLVPVVLSVILGSTLGLVYGRLKGKTQNTPVILGGLTLVLLGASAAHAYYAGQLAPQNAWSSFAPTRHIALSAFWLVSTLIYAAALIGRRS